MSVHVSKMVEGDGDGLTCDEGHLGHKNHVSNKTFKLMATKHKLHNRLSSVLTCFSNEHH